MSTAVKHAFTRLSISEENQLLRGDAEKARSKLMEVEGIKRGLEDELTELKKINDIDLGYIQFFLF
jgi:hypothetical protein